MALSPDLEIENVSPVSAATTNGRFQRDSFCLNLSTLPDSSGFMLKSALRSPHLIESPNGLFSGNSGMSATYRKRPRNMSQSSGTDREMSINGTPPAQSQSGSTAPTSYGSHSEPRPANKKRPSTDTLDYPRRRATIAVQQHSQSHISQILTFGSVRSVDPENPGVMETDQNAGFAPNSTQNASTENQASS
jgi:hypothetical protein